MSASSRFPFVLRPLTLALLTGFLMAGCGGSDGEDLSVATLPEPPKGLGTTDTAAVQDETKVLPFVDFVSTNQRGDARYATLDTNAGVRVVSGMLALWQPSSLIVDAGVTAPANGSFPAVTASPWTGIPGDATDGKVLNTAVHAANIQYVMTPRPSAPRRSRSRPTSTTAAARASRSATAWVRSPPRGAPPRA